MNKAAAEDISAKELARRDFIINGNLWKVVFVLMFPLFLFSIFNYVYSIIDTIMCAGISKEAVNAVSALSQVTNMITALGTGIASGGSILIAREIGRKDYERAQRLSSTVFAYTFLFALATCAVIIPLTDPLLRLMGISDTSIAVGRNYFIVSVVTSAVMMVNTVYLGVEKAKGSMTVITLLNMAVVLLKIGLNALFLYVFHWEDMLFVSLATLVANFALTVYIVARLASRHYVFRFSKKKIDWTRYTAGRLTEISFPIFLGKFIFSLGKVVINGLAKAFGDDVVGALGVSNNMGGAITNPISSVEDSTSSIVSTNLGAGKVKRAIDTFYVGLVYSAAIAVVGVILISVFNDPITMFFARSIEDPEEKIAYAHSISQVFFYEKMGIITLAINSSVLGLLYGFGYTRLSMLINVARVFAFRIPSFLFCQYCLPGLSLSGYQVAGISMGFSNIAIGIVAIVVAINVITRITRREKNKEDAKTLTETEQSAITRYLKNYLSTYTYYKESKVWCYEDGVVLLGAYRMFKATRDKDYLDFAIHYFEEAIAPDGTLRGYDPANGNTDDLQPGVALYYVDTLHHEEKFTRAMERMDRQFKLAPRTKEGSFYHKGKYPHQVWLDGLYMAEPYYALEGCKHGSFAMRKDVLRQFRNVEKRCHNPEDGLYYHGYDESKTMKWADKKTGRSPNVWLRSVGWLAMAECDCCSYFHLGHADIASDKLKPLLRKTLASMKPYEDPSTHLYKDLPCIDDPRNYFETSGSLMLAYAYLRGARENMLPYAEMKDGIDIFEGVIRQSFDGSHLSNIVRVSGLDNELRDGTVAYYLSEQVVSDDAKGVGPLMMAYSEYLSLSY